MERARTEFMRSLGFGKDYIFNRDLMFVVRDVAVEYRCPHAWTMSSRPPPAFAALRGASMVFFQSVMRGDEVLAQGEMTVACVDRSGLKPRRLPPASGGNCKGCRHTTIAD